MTGVMTETSILVTAARLIAGKSVDGGVLEGTRLRLIHARQPAETAWSPDGRDATTATRRMATAAAPHALWSQRTSARGRHAACRHVIPDVETAPGSDQKPVMTETFVLLMAARLIAR